MGKKTKVGGQAVIEGVMMRGPKKYAVAIKKYNGNVILDKGEIKSIKDKVKILNLFVLRGIIAFFESLVLGMKTLIFSADYFDMEEKSVEDKFVVSKEEEITVENRAKIDRDTSIAKIVTEINRNIFNILMDHPERKLACYGTLVDSCYISGMQSENGKVSGYIDYDTDGIAYFTYESNTGTVDVKLYSCTHAIDFRDMDNYEGDAYDRICIPVNCAGSVQIANIYERKYSYE